MKTPRDVIEMNVEHLEAEVEEADRAIANLIVALRTARTDLKEKRRARDDWRRALRAMKDWNIK